MEKEKQKPEKKFRVGAVAAAIWKRSHESKDGKKFETFQVSLDRIWLDQDGSYRSSGNFGINDIPKAILAMQQAYEFIATKASTDGDGSGKE